MKRCLALIIWPMLLAACSTQAPTTLSGNHPIEEIEGADIHYEPYHPMSLYPYQLYGKSYPIEKSPEHYSQVGYSTWYSPKQEGQLTTINEVIDNHDLAGAHASLPLPSYVRITNLNTQRKLVIRLNHRVIPVKKQEITLTKAVADRLNLTPSTKIRVDFIQVAADHTLSGPGSEGTVIVQRSYPLPENPSLIAIPTESITPALSEQLESVQPISVPATQNSLFVH